MKYLYRSDDSKTRYYTEDRQVAGDYLGLTDIHNAAVRNDPDDFLLDRKEMESYGYELVIMTDKEYFLARLNNG